ncbi:DUF2147 domain-containing protein [Manganibacter manganicus]|uniref:DUF2147 domain-containing protein n=1 Tax=Manganibacter manganicus TaxID=1873176 RepID=A0A1V8RNB8_9HYPH|nr:DUF2147 domain-containing protein [Pseudaminobacter manganicus]OQM74459.1 hypothetical protein BFN67_21870 [Pseudaminobacter manganicus]
MIRQAIAVCVFALTCLFSISAQASDPYGIWARDDGNARVKIAPCGAKLCATNLWIKDTSKGEEVGDRLIMSLERKSDTELSGTAFDPKRDRTYSMTLIIEKNGLITRGCIIGGLLCRDVNWAPVK